MRSAPARTPGDFLTLEDNQLVVELMHGHHDALTVLMERYKGLVFRIARSIIGDEGEAEETVQQVFLEVYKAIGQFDHRRGTFKGWLWRRACHRAITRKEHLETRRFYNWTELDEDLLGAIDDGLQMPFNLSRQERALLVDQLLAALPASEREVIKLKLTGMTVREIAEQLTEPVSGVTRRFSRALQMLRMILAKDGSLAKTGIKTDVTNKEKLVVQSRTL